MLWVSIVLGVVVIVTWAGATYDSIHFQRILSLKDETITRCGAKIHSLESEVDLLKATLQDRDERIKFMTLELNERKEIICKIQEALI